MIKAIIFDFDGVILESLEIKTEAFKKLYQPYGLSVSNKVVEHHLSNGGMSRFEKITIYHKQFLGEDLDDEKVQNIAKNFSELVINELINVNFVDGAKNFIKNNYNKYLMFISSATPQDELNFICRKRRISEYFNGIYGSPNLKLKHISFIINNWSLRNQEIVFVGDSLSDLKAANESNICFIARITDNSGKLYNERYTLSNLNNLEKIVLTINQDIRNKY